MWILFCVLCIPCHLLIASVSLKTLVIFTGSIRGSDLAHASFEEHVLKPLHADLLLCTNETPDHTSRLHQLATYLVEYPVVTDPRQFADRLSLHLFGNIFWRRYLPGVLGYSLIGIYDQANEWTGLGTGLLTLCARRYALQYILDKDLLNKYDFFIISRTDFYYLKDHPQPTDLLNDLHHVAIPFIHSQEWIPDRHAVLDKIGLIPYLGATDLLLKPIYWKTPQNQIYLIPFNNIEHVLYTALLQAQLPIVRYRVPCYAVRSDSDSVPTWSKGKQRDQNGLWIKEEGDWREALTALEEGAGAFVQTLY